MGLDMNAFAVDASVIPAGQQVNFTLPEGYKPEELMYWRKHPNLHGWMERLYRNKGGAGEFNCQDVLIEEDDLDALEKDVLADALPKTAGFFFGQSRPEDKERDLKFIAAARRALAEGKLVFYTSWW